jgi:hypothetical protein
MLNDINGGSSDGAGSDPFDEIDEKPKKSKP